MVLATLFFSRGTSLLLLTLCVYWQPALRHPEGEAYIKVLSLPITQFILSISHAGGDYQRIAMSVPKVTPLPTSYVQWGRRGPAVFRRSSFTMIWCLLRLPYRSCLLQRPNFKTYGKNYTRFKLYHLSSKHKIICNRNYFSSEALLVLYLPLVCFRLGSILTGAGHGSQATK